eukprot:COSAG06_NODE_126_length_22759_cov_18.486761_5_plen_1733_part_00
MLGLERADMVLPTGSMVWYDHPADGFVPARVTQPGTKQVTVATVDTGETHTMKIGAAEIGRVFAESLEPQRDLLVFKAPLGPAVLHNLRLAHRAGLPFISVGAVLVVCWPGGGQSPHCGPRALWEHSACQLSEHSAPQPPHIYELAARAHRWMLRDEADQAIVMSGDSGSGKSELARLCTQLLLEIRTLGRTPGAPATVAVRHLHAARLLAAFGTAETVRNRSASRFGKSTSLHFDLGTGHCVGGEIQAFQLELSRVAGPCDGGPEGRFREERNYHIFYQLCAGAQPDLRDRHAVLDSSDYMLTARSPYAAGEQQTDERIDAREWAETEAAFAGMGVSEDDTESLLAALSAILRLSNLDFAPTEGAAGPDSMRLVDGQYGQSLSGDGPDTAAVAARLLGLSRAELEKALCYASVEAGREQVELPLSASECADRRTKLATQLYARLFEWLVAAANKAVASTGDVRCISILDLPGHAVYEVNTLENLCSNYACEKLAAHCYRQLVKVEHALYVAEQFHVPDLDKALDNQPVIDLLEGNQHTMKNPGLLELVHEATRSQGHNDDAKLLEELNEAYGAKKQSHPKYAKPTQAKPPAPKVSGLLVRHAHGDVNYSIVGFSGSGSNRKLQGHLTTTMQHSSNRFLAKLFFVNEGTGSVADETQASVVMATSKQLFTDLGRTACHFVRCIRPASVLAGGFDGARVQAQIRAAQLVDLTSERQTGFPVRFQPAAFVQRFKMLSSRGSTSAEQILKECIQDELVDRDGWQIGTTSVFLRDSCSAALELARSARVAESVRVLDRWLSAVRTKPMWRDRMGPLVQMQAIVKGVLARSEFKKMRVDRQHIARLEKGLAAAVSRQSGGVGDPDDLDDLQSSLIDAVEEDYPCTELTYLIRDAKRVVPELRAYRRTEDLLAAAVSPPSKISLLEALFEAKSISLSSGALVERAQASYDQSYAPKAGLGTEADAKEAKASLKQALEYFSKYPGERFDDRRRRLAVALNMAAALNVGGVDALVQDAQAAVEQLRGEMEWIADASAAMDARKPHYLSGAVDRGQKHKVHLKGRLAEAQRLCSELQKDQEAEAELVEALRKDSPSALRAAIAKAGGDLVPSSLAAAQQRAKELRAEGKRFSLRYASANKKKSTKSASPDASIDVQAFVMARQEERGQTSLNRLGAAPMLRSAADTVLAFDDAMLTRPLVECSNFQPGQRVFAAEALMTARSILGWTGDMPFHSPYLCAREILQRGRTHQALRDEICLQLCRHADGTGTDGGTSCIRALQLLQLCCACFGVSKSLKRYLLHYFYEKVAADPSYLVQKVCAETIAHVLRGPTIDLPSADAIDGLRAGEGVRDISLTTAKGSTRVPIEDESTVAEIATAAADARGVQYSGEYGLYGTNTAAGDRVRIPLLPSDELANAMRKISGDMELDGLPVSAAAEADKKKKNKRKQGRERRADVRLFLQKRLIFHGEVETASDTDVHELYTRCKETAGAGQYGITDASEALLLAALAAWAQYGDTAPALSAELVLEWLEAHVPAATFKRWRPELWIEDFANVISRFEAWSKLEAKANYVRICQRYPLFGSELYAASKRGRGLKEIPSQCLIGVSWAGVAIYNIRSGASGSKSKAGAGAVVTPSLISWSFNELVSWSATADGRGLCLVTLKHDKGEEDGPGREKAREFQCSADSICQLLTDYATAYSSGGRSAFLESVPLAREKEEEGEDEEEEEEDEDDEEEDVSLPDDV